ncbi:MAG: type II CAAX endopeptidase family protein [Sphingomicrobium sp.]
MTEPKPTHYSAGDPLWIRVLEYPLIALVLATVLAVTTYASAYFLLSYNPPMSGAMTAISETIMVVALLWVVYKLVIRHFGDKPHDDLPLAGAVMLTAQGAALGTVMMGLIVGVAALTGAYAIVGPGDTRQFVLTLLLFAILPACWEELLFRGIFFRWLEEFGGSWFALGATSLLFGFAHQLNPNATLMSSVFMAASGGILLGASYMATRSLWLPIGLHAAWNFVQGEVFDVPVSGVDTAGLVESQSSGPEWLSGGYFGLEASVISLVVCLAVSAWLLRRASQRGLVFGPIWSRDSALTFEPQRKL